MFTKTLINPVKKYSVTETIENGEVMVTYHPRIWVVGHELHWPPSDNVDRRVCIPPGPNWTRLMCTVLKDNIETHEEALQQERFYSRHRNSDSFRKEQKLKQLKRKHPVNANLSGSDLIDLNALVDDINDDIAKNAAKPMSISSRHLNPKQTSHYHGKCLDVKSKSGTVKKPSAVRKPIPALKDVSKIGISKSKLHQVDDVIKPKLPRYDNFLKSGKAKSKLPQVDDVTKPKFSRYDNYLKSGNTRSNLLFTEGKGKLSVSKVKIPKAPSATITKEQYLKRQEKTDDKTVKMDQALPENSAYISPLNSPQRDKIINCGTDEEKGTSQCFGDYTRNASETSEGKTFERNGNLFYGNFQYDENSDNDEINITEGTNRRKINVLDDIVIKPATNVPSDGPMSFENGVLKEIRALTEKVTENQKSFEARIEKRLNNFFIDQSRMQHPYMHHPYVQHPYVQHPYVQHPHDVNRNGRNRNYHQQQPVAPAPYGIDDFDDFEEFDKNFPIRVYENIEELEWNVRQDLDFKFRLKARLNELSGKDEKKTIRLKMKYLFADEALERYTWRGTERKKPFNKLKSLNKLILQSVRVDFKNYKYKDYKAYMITWVKHAKTRQRTVTYSYPDQKKSKSDESGSGEDDDEDDDDSDQEVDSN